MEMNYLEIMRNVATEAVIVLSEFYSTAAAILGEDQGVSRDMVMNIFNSGIGSIMDEEP